MTNVIFLILAAAATLAFPAKAEVTMGAARIDAYIDSISDKRVALFSNHTSLAYGNMHTLDLLLDNNVDVRCVFSPEHGFRGNADAGEAVSSSIDAETGLPIVSLYGKGHAHQMQQALDSIDAVLVDIQDVGTRFYTYYCTMLELMDACAQRDIKFIVLDRPNPIGMMVDGPMLDMKYASGVGRLPLPVAHGLTLGEMAMMANGEGWLPSKIKTNLTVIPCLGYTHQTRYQLPIPPSPNLRTMKAIYLYPSLCYFEATDVSIGRGTDMPFTIYGHPKMSDRDFAFTPKSMPGATNPPQKDVVCHGVNLNSLSDEQIIENGVDLSYLIDAYNDLKEDKFLNSFFEKLIGDGYIREMIKNGATPQQIKDYWQPALDEYKTLRQRYLLYPQ